MHRPRALTLLLAAALLAGEHHRAHAAGVLRKHHLETAVVRLATNAFRTGAPAVALVGDATLAFEFPAYHPRISTSIVRLDPGGSRTRGNFSAAGDATLGRREACDGRPCDVVITLGHAHHVTDAAEYISSIVALGAGIVVFSAATPGEAVAANLDAAPAVTALPYSHWTALFQSGGYVLDHGATHTLRRELFMALDNHWLIAKNLLVFRLAAFSPLGWWDGFSDAHDGCVPIAPEWPQGLQDVFRQDCQAYRELVEPDASITGGQLAAPMQAPSLPGESDCDTLLRLFVNKDYSALWPEAIRQTRLWEVIANCTTFIVFLRILFTVLPCSTPDRTSSLSGPPAAISGCVAVLLSVRHVSQLGPPGVGNSGGPR